VSAVVSCPSPPEPAPEKTAPVERPAALRLIGTIGGDFASRIAAFLRSLIVFSCDSTAATDSRTRADSVNALVAGFARPLIHFRFPVRMLAEPLDIPRQSSNCSSVRAFSPDRSEAPSPACNDVAAFRTRRRPHLSRSHAGKDQPFQLGRFSRPSQTLRTAQLHISGRLPARLPADIATLVSMTSFEPSGNRQRGPDAT